MLAVASLCCSVPALGNTIATVTCQILNGTSEVNVSSTATSCDESITFPVPVLLEATATVSESSMSGSAQSEAGTNLTYAESVTSFDQSFTVPTTITWSYTANALGADTDVAVNLAGLRETCIPSGSGPASCTGPMSQTLLPGDYTFTMTIMAAGVGNASAMLNEVSVMPEAPEPATFGLAAPLLLLGFARIRR